MAFIVVPLMNIAPLLVLVISRWGFRQVDKSLPGGSTAASLTFMHPNFIRGDKQRCLLMRSIVKKPVRTSSLRQSSAHQHGEAALDRAAAIPLHLTHHPTTIQTFGPSVRRLGQLQQSVSSPGIAQQASTGTAIHPLSLSVQNLAYQGRPPTLQISTTAIPDRFSSAIASSAPTSSSTSMQHHSAGILKRLLVQQRQDELVRHIRDRINDGIMAISMSRPTELALPPFDQPRMMQPVQPAAVLGSPARAPSFGHHHANDFGRRLNSGYMNVAAAGSDTPEVAVLAAQIMKSNPGIAPSRAFELAKKAFTRA